MGRLVVFLRRQFKRRMPDLATYSKQSFGQDLSAGITVGIVALPLSLALAIATGVPPILGLYTAAIAGFMAALFSGSPYSVSGPAAAMVPILAAIIQQHGLKELPYITILAGLFLGLFALIGVGKYIHKVPESVVLGFTAGVAIVIFVSQLNNFLGLSGLTPHEHFAGRLADTVAHIPTINLPTVLLGVAALLIIVFAHRLRYIGKIPATLIAVICTTLVSLALPFFHSTATLGSVYGALPVGIPAFILPQLDLGHLLHKELWIPALQIAGLIAVESLLCAVVADKLTKKRHQSNQELAAQAVANLSSAMFGAMPATGVIARTGTIIKSGAVSRLASIVHALVVLAFIAALAPFAAHIPLTVLSAVLLVTAVKISEYKEVARFVRKKNWQLGSVLIVTLTLTVFADLIVGVGAGLVLHLAYAAHGYLRGSRGRDGELRLSEEEAL